MNIKEEKAFAQQLEDFEAAMQNDFNKRSSEVAKKWEFDFSSE